MYCFPGAAGKAEGLHSLLQEGNIQNCNLFHAKI